MTLSNFGRSSLPVFSEIITSQPQNLSVLATGPKLNLFIYILHRELVAEPETDAGPVFSFSNGLKLLNFIEGDVPAEYFDCALVELSGAL